MAPANRGMVCCLIALQAYLLAGLASEAASGETAANYPLRTRVLSVTATEGRGTVATRSTASGATPLPHPPVQGFLPLIAITTSDERSTTDFDFEHVLASPFTGQPLNAPADRNYVIGVLDTGSQVDLAAGTYADTLGLKGPNLSPATFPVGGVGGTVDAPITEPLGFFAAGLGAIDSNGLLDLSQVVGHTNVCALVVPQISCSTGEEIRAIAGMPMLAFYTSLIQQDQHRRVVQGDKTYVSPDVQLLQDFSPDPNQYTHRIPLEINGLSPATTASYYAFPDLEDFFAPIEPLTPTLLSMFALSFPTGGAFFTDIGLLQGQAGPLNTIQYARVMVDTGAQSSIISSTLAAKLNLPLKPDFTAEVCGLGGSNQLPGYYIDYVRINALGGALEFARVPFVVFDIDSPEGGPLDGILGTNFFWNRNLAIQPNGSGSAYLHVSEPVAYAYVDLNADGTVDLKDFATFASAWRTSPKDAAWNPGCDLFVDEVVDSRDLAAFAESWNQAHRH
jgi:hypothetical protein